MINGSRFGLIVVHFVTKIFMLVKYFVYEIPHQQRYTLHIRMIHLTLSDIHIFVCTIGADTPPI